jgi:hypothetical protein
MQKTQTQPPSIKAKDVQDVEKQDTKEEWEFTK